MCEDIGGAESTMNEIDVKDLGEWMSIKDIEERMCIVVLTTVYEVATQEHRTTNIVILFV